MATKKKLLEAAAGSAGGAGLDVNEVFSTYLYDGNGTSQTITNGIDLSGEGGLVWIKNRANGARHHGLFDTERGIYKAIYSNQSWVEDTNTGYLTAFNSDGFSIGSVADFNGSGEKHTSWTFRKAPKFFDVVTYTGNGVAGRTVSHNLGSVPGCIIVKRRDSTADWTVYHRGIASDAETDALFLNLINAAGDHPSYWNDTAPTSTEFTVGNGGEVNSASGTYVAYLFAHNDGDGEFGPTGDQDIIKCGSYTGDGTNNGSNIVDVGFEPQWLLVKKSSGAANWILMDNMRGFVANATQSSSAGDTPLSPDETWNEAVNTYAWAAPTPNGFALENNFSSFNENGATYIYIAIRRGPMAVPESATEVFTPLVGLTSADAPPLYQATHTIDMVIDHLRLGDSAFIIDRLRGNKLLKASGTDAESGNATYTWDYQTGAFNRSAGATTWYIGQCFRRAPSFFDVVAYTGNGVAGRTVSHNLGVAPEMIWVKQRNVSRNWVVYNETLGAGKYLKLNDINATITNTQRFDTAPTEAVFTVGNDTEVNGSGGTYIAYLFASLDGISKVGSYTGNGSTQTIDCGFSSGARFVLIKRTDSTGDWYVWDAERGIVSANDPHLSLNTTAAEVTTDDSVDPVSSGFAVNQVAATNINVSSASYIYYAVS